jgi:hypothetical protein
MSILVVCPGCKKSFQVQDKFAGKTGPCPKCKTTITVPEKAAEVKIHGAQEFADGGRSTKGQLLTKPIARKKFQLNPVLAAAVGGATLGLIVVAWLAGGVISDYWVVRALGLLLVSPALALAAYSFLYDDELEPYRGIPLYIRTAACSAVYVLLWAVFVYVRGAVQTTGPAGPEPIELWMWTLIAPPFLALGGAAAWLSFDLEPGNGFFHYAFYLLATSLLGWLAGLGWPWGAGI